MWGGIYSQGCSPDEAVGGGDIEAGMFSCCCRGGGDKEARMLSYTEDVGGNRGRDALLLNL
jgi:hypothetical protein